MDDEAPPLIADQPANPAERSLVEDVRQLVSDGRTLLDAELAYQKSRAAVAGQGAKGIAGWGALALALVLFTLMALVLGFTLALSASIGPWLATAVMVLGLSLATGLSAMTAARRWKRMASQLAKQDPAP